MHLTQPRLTPERIYEPNIIHNPRTWMGIWTPHGWRVHPKRFAKAEGFTVKLSGDGKTTFFPEALLDPKTGKVGWQDDLHFEDELFTDHSLYAADPRVEYPAGRPRWAISHTLLCYPYCDHNLYTHEYLWDMTHGHLQTHFRKHIIEQARTDDKDGKTVTVQNKPISLTIEGNVQYPMPNSAVRGVWDNPDKTGENFYTRRIVQLISMHNGVYAISPHVPVVQCYGIWETLEGDPLDEVFDSESAECTDRQRLIDQFKIPLDEPKIAMISPQWQQSVFSSIYQQKITQLKTHYGKIGDGHMLELNNRMGSHYMPGKIGYAAQSQFAHELDADKTYDTTWDYNEDGIIDEHDKQTLSKHMGREVRFNIYRHAYYGGNWLTTFVGLEPEHRPGVKAIADYVYGGGYDSQAGIIHLQQTPGPNKPVWVEYHYDAPAEPGVDNIVLHLYREL